MKVFMILLVTISSISLIISLIMLTDRHTFRKALKTVKCPCCNSRNVYIENWVTMDNRRNVGCRNCGHIYTIGDSWR
jgi:hypothetical protein